MTDDQLCELVGKRLPPYRILYQGDYHTFSFQMLLKCFIRYHKVYKSGRFPDYWSIWCEHLIYQQFMEERQSVPHETN